MALTLVHNNLTLYLPDDWEDASQIVALGPVDNLFRPNIVFSDEPSIPGETSQEFAARQLAPLRAQLTNFVLVQEGVRRFGPNEGFLREQSFSMEKGDIQQMQFYMVQGARAYSFTVTHLRDRLNEVRTIAEQVFAQFRISQGLDRHVPFLPDADAL
jgi:hypothetical protein